MIIAAMTFVVERNGNLRKEIVVKVSNRTDGCIFSDTTQTCQPVGRSVKLPQLQSSWLQLPCQLEDLTNFHKFIVSYESRLNEEDNS
jgi:hypothetical protein